VAFGKSIVNSRNKQIVPIQLSFLFNTIVQPNDTVTNPQTDTVLFSRAVH